MTSWRKLGSFVADFFRLNGRYLVDFDQRNRMREVLKRDGMTTRQRAIVRVETRRTPELARAYAGLVSTSVSLSGIELSASSAPSLNLLIPEVGTSGGFAGLRTALIVARRLAGELGLPIRIIELNFPSPGTSLRESTRFIAEVFGPDQFEVVHRSSILRTTFSPQDVWLATHWTTAHAVQVACESSVLAANRVVYLIQDYEPAFHPASVESVVASSTYHAGFVALVNSRPVWRYLCDEEDVIISDDLVFSPSFDTELLVAAAQGRHASDTVTVLFYARPSKPRNLYRLGIAVLRASVTALGGSATVIRFVSAGGQHAQVDLGGGHRLVGLGKLPPREYADLLSNTSVMLSLQQSAHPSHPPFDAAISGALAVTNDFHGSRNSLHPRIAAVGTDVRSLAAALTDAIRQSIDSPPTLYLPLDPVLLGRPLDDVIAAAIESLGAP